MRPVLVTGAKGMLGREVVKKFQQMGYYTLAYDKDELDLTDMLAVSTTMKVLNPKLIVNCAAFTDVDGAEKKENQIIATKVNAEAPLWLASCSPKDCILIQISTDYVFDGLLDMDNFYYETYKTNPLSVYGMTKLNGELAALTKPNTYVLRTSWMFGDGKNFVRTMDKLLRSKPEISVVNDQVGSPTYSVDLAEMIYSIYANNIPYGIYHTTNLVYTSWYDFACLICKYLKLSCNVIPVTSDKFVTLATRPKNSQLSKDKIVRCGIVPRCFEEALYDYLKKEGVLV